MGNRIFLRWAVVLPLGLLWMASAASCSQVVPGSKGEPPSPTDLIGPPITSIDGVSFSLDPAVAAGAQGQVVPENPGSQDGPYWEVHPQYVSISLDGYPLSGTQMNPGIYIYPIEDYGRLSPQAGGILDSLKDFLVQKPSDADQIPFLPIFNAGQVFHSNVDWLDFQNGSGVRFLTIYAQYPAPVNNQDLFYTFQGLTSDGRHSVSVILPVNHPALPADLAAVSESEMEAILHDYDLYREDVAAALSAPSGSSLFTPDLAQLDAIVASLTVAR